ncbi:MAG: hypothetical protein FJ255_04800 [Phycisphaerae bacterium]|nr:hypothetical protein [Phycisphaerae bacterium]
MAVDRCNCRNVGFAELIELARRERLDLDELRDRTGCAQQCGLCVPYIREALRTGQPDQPLAFKPAAGPKR